MRIATFNVENLFDRARALSGATWEIGKPALSAHRSLNTLFNKQHYSAADKRRMLTLLKEQGLTKQDNGPMLRLRKIRGTLLTRSRTRGAAIVANGRADWIGWVELIAQAVDETATLNTARVINALAADVLAVVEAEDRLTLRLFNEQVLPKVGELPFAHVMLVDGNDDRGIDVGIMTRGAYPILSIRTHIDDVDETGRIFSRDCCEYELALPDGSTLWLLVNHFKSKGYGSQVANDEKRRRQAVRVREIVEDHLRSGETQVVVLGDLNDTPNRDTLAPLLKDSPLTDVCTLPQFDDGGRPGTHGNCGASQKLDHLLISRPLVSRVRRGGIERRGMWGGKNGTLWPRFEEVKSAGESASDHAGLWVELA